MPTVLLMDVSLSMCRPVLEELGDHKKLLEENGEAVLYKNLAAIGCNQILDHFSQHCKLEFTALVIFSSLFEVVARFTRDFELIKSSLVTLEDYDKTSLQVGLMGASQHILEEWGNGTPCQIVLVTDGNAGIPDVGTLRSMAGLSLPFPFPAKINIVCICNPQDEALKASKPIYHKLIEMNGEGCLYIPERNLSVKSIITMFEKVIEDNFVPYKGTIHCGHLNAGITLSPPSQHYYRRIGSESVREMISEDLRICGFLNISDVSSPPAYSRHLVLSTAGDVSWVAPNGNEEEGAQDDGRKPSFCVLLHGGLKRENTVALCLVGNEWFGIFYSWADSKKRFNLMLSVFEPGLDVIPWMGRLNNLGPAESLPVNPYDKNKPSATPFPIKATEKRSYAQSCVVWVRAGGLQSDIQKILRHARKLPEKHVSFYKELNRVRRAALTYGFPELLVGLASLLERECYNLAANTHPEAAIQLQHASECLRSWETKDPRQNIQHYKSGYD